MENLEVFLKVAKESALIGGLVLKEHFGRLSQDDIKEKFEKDVVSIVDRISEERIRKYIKSNFPHHHVVGEEEGGEDKGEYVWYIDPLDGTKNYIAGFPIFGVSVGLTYRKEPIVGAVYLPYFDALYWALKGGGAYKNGKRVQVSKRKQVRQFFVAYGFPSRAKRDLNIYWRVFRDLFDKVGAMRRPGAAAVDLCFVAEGVFDGLVEFELNPWDVCAGTIIVQEAGGRVYLTKGLSKATDVIAGTPDAYPYIENAVKFSLEGL
ncbi:MAG: inositol monophosphatase [Hydrogenobacter thermophilus]|uniref:inositol monophosphatase family protein n=1 Tax=Hydrogenobacter thermophilus TaxID=940 RepID=UPI0030FB386D|nr:inositol monophosphatase [Hydrogenobacter thermophilus]